MKSIQESQQRFYLANNRLGNFNELDIDVGTWINNIGTTAVWGSMSCYLQGVYDSNDPKAYCSFSNDGSIIRYQVYIFNTIKYCIVTSKKNTDFEKLCEQETGKIINCEPETTACFYRY